LEPLEPIDTASSDAVFDLKSQAALRRIKARATASGLDPLIVLCSEGVAAWEQMVTDSFDKGLSMDILIMYYQYR